jgi:hypothetical protein
LANASGRCAGSSRLWSGSVEESSNRSSCSGAAGRAITVVSRRRGRRRCLRARGLRRCRAAPTRQCLLDRVTTDCRGAASRSVLCLVGRAISDPVRLLRRSDLGRRCVRLVATPPVPWWVTLARERRWVALPNDHRPAAHASVSMADLLNESFLAAGAGSLRDDWLAVDERDGYRAARRPRSASVAYQGSVRGSPKCGRTPPSWKRVMAAMRSPSSVSTSSPEARAIGACASWV